MSSDEYLNYAMINRRKWEKEGDAITAAMVARLDEAEDAKSPSPVDFIAMDVIIEEDKPETLDLANGGEDSVA